jgi:hypothetical protein
MKTLIIGYGEVGEALAEVLEVYDPIPLDINDSIDDTFEIMHICFPYSEKFVDSVLAYRAKYRPAVTVIHSTVPVGTSRKCGSIHSPIRGIHPHLAQGIRTFVKMIGGERASQVADYFRRSGLRVMLFDKQETTEASKLFETESYRVQIEFCHRVKAFCDQNGLNFHEVYTLQAMTYNSGYTELGYPEYVRPILQPIDGPIGGHCVQANKALIEQGENVTV